MAAHRKDRQGGVTGGAPDSAADRAGFVNPFDDLTLLKYFSAVRDWHGFIRFIGLPHFKDNPDIPIPRLFVEPHVSDQALRPDDVGRAGASRTRPVTDELIEHPRLVLLGDPGSGKSTLVNWLAWLFTDSGDSVPTSRLGRLIPVPMVLRELPINDGITWSGLLAAFLAHPVSAAFEKDRARLEAICRRGQALFLIDGLDEVGNVEVRKKLRDAVHDGFETHAACRWVLTSRAVGYEQVTFDRKTVELLPDPEILKGAAGWVHADFGPTGRGEWEKPVARLAHVAPFSDEQIETFARHWYAAREAVRAESDRKAGDLLAALRRNEDTRRLARTPNLLAMIALIHRVQAVLPNGRCRLYDRIAEAYLESIDTARGLRENEYTLAQRAAWLAEIGFRMQLERDKREGGPPGSGGGEILVEQRVVERWLREAMRRSRPGATEKEARDFLDYLGRRSGLLLPRAPGQDGQARYAFTHLSFQEYFAACRIADAVLAPYWVDGKGVPEGARHGDLKARVGKSIWRETFVLLFEKLAERTGWPDELARLLFETGAVASGYSDNRWGLLAEVSVDPQSGLSDETRRKVWKKVWPWTFSMGHPFESSATPMVEVENELTDGVWKAFHEVADAGNPAVARFEVTTPRVVTEVSRLTTLRKLVLHGIAADANLSALSRLTQLQELWLGSDASTIGANLSTFRGVSNLRHLILQGHGFDDLTPLRELTQLTNLYLFNSKTSDLAPIAALTSLRSLDCGSTGVGDLSPLTGLKKLEDIRLVGTSVSDIEPLAGLQKLHRLDIRWTRIRDFSPLLRMPALKQVTLGGAPGAVVAELRKRGVNVEEMSGPPGSR